MKLSTDIEFIGRKMSVIVYMSVLNFLITSFLSRYIVKLLVKYDSNKSFIANYRQLASNIAIISIYAYVLRSISERIPLPFQTNSFDPKRVKEVKGSVLTAFTMFLFFGETMKTYLPLLNGISQSPGHS